MLALGAGLLIPPLAWTEGGDPIRETLIPVPQRLPGYVFRDESSSPVLLNHGRGGESSTIRRALTSSRLRTIGVANGSIRIGALSALER